MLKKLIEKRNALIEEMQSLVDTAETETRSFTQEETERYNQLKEEILGMDKVIAAHDESRSFEKASANNNAALDNDTEERAFENYIRGQCGLEVRAGEQNLTMTNNGAVIPTTIAKRIITAVTDICPIYRKATIYHVKGTLKVPVWGKANSTHDITVGYQTEFTDITADSGRFTSVDLSGYLAGALTLLGLSVVNNADVDVVEFVVQEMSRKIAAFLEGELLKGSGSSAATGALSTTNTLNSAAATAITSDELITLQAKVKQVYQKDACWIMHPDTFLAIKKLKDGNNRYLLQDDFTNEVPYRLLGKPVYLSDNMPTMAAGAKTVLYGDISGLAVNMRENLSMQVLREKYATQHAVGIVAWFEFDSKVVDNQKLAVLTMKAS